MSPKSILKCQVCLSYTVFPTACRKRRNSGSMAFWSRLRSSYPSCCRYLHSQSPVQSPFALACDNRHTAPGENPQIQSQLGISRLKNHDTVDAPTLRSSLSPSVEPWGLKCASISLRSLTLFLTASSVSFCLVDFCILTSSWEEKKYIL